MKKYWRYIKRICYMSNLKLNAYPLNAYARNVTDYTYLFTVLATLYFSYKLIPGKGLLQGTTVGQACFVFLMFQSCFYFLCIFSLRDAMMQATYGQIDDKLIRPIPSMLALLMQEIKVNYIKNIIITILFFTVAGFLFRFQLSSIQLLELIFTYITSCIVFLSIDILLIDVSFYFEIFRNGPNPVNELISSVVRYPKEVFPKYGQYILFPLFFIVTPVFSVLNNTFTLESFFLQFFGTISIAFLALLFWRKGIRKYSSSN